MKVCQNCKQTNPIEAMFCRQCASPLGGGQAQQQQQQYGNAQQQVGQQQQWNQANYGGVQQQNSGTNTGGGASSRATISAVLAVIGLLCCFFAGIPAAILGWLEIQAIKEGKSSAAGMTMAQIGLWLGIAGTIINAILYFIGLIITSIGGGGGY